MRSIASRTEGVLIVPQGTLSSKKEVTFGRQKLLLFCERATKGCVKWGKNDQK